MTGLDVSRHVIVEIAALVTDGELEPLDDGIDVIVHQPPEALAEMDDFVRKMHTKSALLPEIEASTVSLADAGAQALDYVRRHVPEAGDRAAVRQLDRRRPPLPRPAAPRARPLPALPQHRRVELQGAVPALVPRGVQEAAGQGGDAPRARRRRTSRSPSCATTASTCCVRRPTRPPTPQARAARAARRGAWSPTARARSGP